jgi:hypothetical protein
MMPTLPGTTATGKASVGICFLTGAIRREKSSASKPLAGLVPRPPKRLVIEVIVLDESMLVVVKYIYVQLCRKNLQKASAKLSVGV